jgi:hypothetical protein
MESVHKANVVDSNKLSKLPKAQSSSPDVSATYAATAHKLQSLFEKPNFQLSESSTASPMITSDPMPQITISPSASNVPASPQSIIYAIESAFT